MERWLSVRAERDVPEERNDLDLLGHRYLAVALRLPVKNPSTASLNAPMPVS
jgi:hypothetical protein